MIYGDHANSRLLTRLLKRILPNSQAVSLAIILLVGSVLIYSLLGLLMPVFVAIVLAYLLEGMVVKAERKVSRIVAVHLVYFTFLTVFGFVLFVLVPVVSEQTVQLVQHIPDFIHSAETEIMRFPERHPELITEARIRQLMFSVQQDLLKYSQDLISGSAQSFVGLVALVIYLFLVPMMVFFLLKDKAVLLNWFQQFLPKDRHLSLRVWREVDRQIANYVRGKFVEVFILWAVSFLVFWWLDLNYAMLLAVLMGLSVVIPYIGATLVTLPVLAVAYLQWGLANGDHFMYVFVAYSVVQAMDGVILVPLLFSEAVNLHPIAIIVAILFFGGLWGFWGVFFAIPLATVVNAVLTAWPKSDGISVDI